MQRAQEDGVVRGSDQASWSTFTDTWDEEPTCLEPTVTMAELIESGGPPAPSPASDR